MTFTKSKQTIDVANSKDNKLELKEVDYGDFKKGVNDISFEITKSGYVVKVNDEDLIKYVKDVKDRTLFASTTSFAKVNQISIHKLNGRLKSYSIDESGAIF